MDRRRLLGSRRGSLRGLLVLRVLVGYLLEDLFCECLAVPLHQARSAAHEALDDKFGALLDSALFRVGLGL